jgi:hypothetical protein
LPLITVEVNCIGVPEQALSGLNEKDADICAFI